MIRLAEFVAGLVGGMVAYIVGTSLLDEWIVGTTVSDNILKTMIPIGIATGIVIGVLVHMFRSPGGGRR